MRFIGNKEKLLEHISKDRNREAVPRDVMKRVI